MHLLVEACPRALPIGVKIPETIPHARKFAYNLAARYFDNHPWCEQVTKIKIDGRYRLDDTLRSLASHFGAKMLWVVVGYTEAGWFFKMPDYVQRFSPAMLIADPMFGGGFAVVLGEENGSLFEVIVEFD